MPDTDETNTPEANAEEIKRMDATERGAQGNVHSEPDPPVEQGAPPPMPH